jgi:6-phosphogluconolactonase
MVFVEFKLDCEPIISNQKCTHVKFLYLTITTFLLTLLFSACAENKADHYLFVGTYTGGASEGIYIYTFNAETGEIDSVGAATGVENPSFLAISDDGSNLYAVNEMADSAEAAVSSFSFDKEEGTLSFLNKQSSGGGAPCYVSIDETGGTVFTGNYVGGSLSVFPVNDDGSLGKVSATIEHTGSGPDKNRQSSPHVHCTVMSPDNSQLYVTDLGTDQVKAYDFKAGADDADLSNEPSFVFNSEPGAGPRHLTFHPEKPYAYLINELNGSIAAFSRDADSLTAIQTVSTLPAGYMGAKSGADIHLSPDGKFLYASNREELNDIVIYEIDEDSGRLTFVGRQSSGGIHPRNFMIDPSGRFLLAANKNSDNVVVFKRDMQTGMLTATGTEIALSQPVCLKMLAID